ncbi:GH92 family glycosyl hydrolase [Actinoplanes sp. TRM 88003]|uniref:GH92 family glycosyl hydrolase n=1 Tax=Paractinoplanes aksuensis TaxID=2939490 RepID=A0ABT1DIK8_9ACTN|nr:GH92 family glycosyl hydrolase [Actinoplanes aksuensis]MCO8270663.1 GH92 family glycosyl hydrolase [Actinoplanes aksuensis]
MHLLLSAVLVAGLAAAPAAAAEEPVDLVRNFVGTENFGNTFPGASAPFGMVQVSPDTGGQGGYDYKQSTIYGFSQTHLSGVGCGVAGELPIMPTTGTITSVDPNSYRSAYSHADEEASPGYYRVGLSTYGVRAELTATERTGWQRYTFPATGSANVLFNTGKANQTVFGSEVHVVGDRTIEGRVEAGNFCAGQDRHTVYFTASFDRPFASFGTWRGSTRTDGSRDAAGSGGNGAYVRFNASSDRDVVVKVGLSYTGVAGARANLAAETAGHDFDATRAALRAKWATALGKIKIDGGTTDRRAAFYTALYHSLLHPNLAGDVDGSYAGFDRVVHKAQGYTPYQNFSLWDTYRPQNQLLELLTPDVARDVALSVLAIGRDGGWLPRWALANSETNIMTGDPVTPFLVEAWSKGLLQGQELSAYELLRANALSEPPAASPFNGRTGIRYYNDRGYIPSGLQLGRDCVHKGGDNDCVHPASATLEYAAADASLALMAAGLGRTADAQLFAGRGQWYRNLWDSSIKQFRPRTTAGTWVTPYDPVAAGQQFHEGGAYQYQWLVPQDPAGLVRLMGGRASTERRLDDFFAYPKLLTDPAGTARTDWIASPYDYYAKPTYNPNNEPDLLAPYMYHWAGAPAKTATVVRAAMTLFTTGPDGMTGNDDLGTMSAWYVFSSLGLYPTMSGANFLAVSSPQFPSAVLALKSGTLTITAPGASDQNRYIQGVRVNNADLTRNWMPWSAVGSGGTIAHTLGTTPSSWGTAAAAEPPSVNQAAPDVPVTCAASSAANQCAVNLSAFRTRDGTATVAAPAEGNFDGGGWSYDAARMPAAGPVTWGGITYDAPDPTGPRPNLVPATGQTLLPPAGSRSAANLVLTSHHGPISTSVTIGYTDGTYVATPVTVADWCGPAASGTTAVLSMPHRIKAGQGVDGPATALFGARLPLTAGKQIRSITLPADPRVYIYAVTFS